MSHVTGFVVMLPLASPPSANESGETPLDIARRLRHEHCEELVSVWPEWVGAEVPGPSGRAASEPGGVGPDQIPVSSMGRLRESVLGSLSRGDDHSPPSDAWLVFAGWTC